MWQEKCQDHGRLRNFVHKSFVFLEDCDNIGYEVQIENKRERLIHFVSKFILQRNNISKFIGKGK